MVSVNPIDKQAFPDNIPEEVLKFLRQKSNRDADKQFFGYIYQYALTLYHILDEKNIWNDNLEGKFYIENKEDYLRYTYDGTNHNKDLVQIKHLSTSNFTIGDARKALLKQFDWFKTSKDIFREVKYYTFYYHQQNKATEISIEDIFSITKMDQDRDARIATAITKIKPYVQEELTKRVFGSF